MYNKNGDRSSVSDKLSKAALIIMGGKPRMRSEMLLTAKLYVNKSDSVKTTLLSPACERWKAGDKGFGWVFICDVSKTAQETQD